MDLMIPDKKFLCIDYPGVVLNTEKMLNSLGNEKNVSKTYHDPSKRLELLFRPRDVGCRPVYGDRQLCSSLVVKVRRRRKHTVCDDQSSIAPSSEASQITEYEYDAQVLGIVDIMYTFQSLSDFQYLPMVRQPDGTYSSIREEVFITRLHSSSWINEPASLFLPPVMFSRFDRPVDYCYREPPQPRPGNEENIPQLAPNVIGVSRKRRPHFTKFIHFTDKDVPTTPHPAALVKLNHKRSIPDVCAEMKKLFESQPVWSRNALYAHTSPSCSLSDVCVVLPAIAYYCVTGPWRSLWVRFGYDPRQHPEAKIYQVLDVRLRRHFVNDVIRVKPKRTSYEYTMPLTIVKNQSQPSVIQKMTFTAPDDDKESRKSTNRSDLDPTYRFKPGVLPAYRQLFYQLCYVEEPEVQSLIHANDGAETECLEKDGWCLRDTMEQCRAILARCIRSSTGSVPATTNELASSSADGERLPREPEFIGQEDVVGVPPGEEDDDDDEDVDVDEEDNFAEETMEIMSGVDDDDDDDDEEMNNIRVPTDLMTEFNH